MTIRTHSGLWSHRLGRGAGRVWRGYRRHEQRAAGWLAAHGMTAAVAKALLWIVKLAVFGALLYFAFWLALLVVALVAVAWGAEHASTADDDVLGSKAQEQDHRQGLFYHPFHHDDDPDPRFGDDQ